ncbi:hypothetical protein LOD99_5384 [Oopsacas minuta]|uniref:Uncharacterized protein n=1 Tax=Oopsacas minuta TaxID=111878 RepID=A0AAV7JR26_9METZ|nr:hypothetical protein LOD99_5384 [Oopsacas minuta]
MLGFLLGLQGGYTKYSCFLCLWNCRADGEHYKKIQWPPRKELMPGKYNVIKEPLMATQRNRPTYSGELLGDEGAINTNDLSLQLTEIQACHHSYDENLAMPSDDDDDELYGFL